MATHHNKYTVGQRLQTAETRCAQLEAAIPRLRLELLTELTNYAEAHFHGKNGVDGTDGNDCVCRSVPGEKGERGDVTYIGPDEVAAAVKQVRTELLTLRAGIIGRLLQGIADAKGTNGTQVHFRKHLQAILSDIEAL